MTPASLTAGWEAPGKGCGVRRGATAPGDWGRADPAERPALHQSLTLVKTFPPGRLTSSWLLETGMTQLLGMPGATALLHMGKPHVPSLHPAVLSPAQAGVSTHTHRTVQARRGSRATWSNPSGKLVHLQQDRGAGATTTGPPVCAAYPVLFPSHLSSCLAGLVLNTLEVSLRKAAEQSSGK